MAFGLGKTRVSPIAIDFGADSIKLLQVVDERPVQLVAAACAVLPEHARQNAQTRLAYMNETVKELLKAAPFRGKRAVCSIPSHQVMTQNVNVPPSDDVGLEDRVHAAMRERFGIEPTRMVLRCFDVGQVKIKGKLGHEALCVAAGREVVDRHLDILHQAKLEVCGMHTEPLALLASFKHLNEREASPDETVMLVDLGGATTKVIVFHGDRLVVARTAQAGGDQMVRELAASRSLEFAEARAVMMSPDHDESGLETNTTFGGAATAVADPVLAGYATSAVTDEIKLAVRRHEKTFPERKIDRLVFTGGGARRADLCRQIAKALNLSAQVGDPIARLMRLNRNKPHGVRFDEPQPGWCVPMGLCLSETDL